MKKRTVGTALAAVREIIKSNGTPRTAFPTEPMNKSEQFRCSDETAETIGNTVGATLRGHPFLQK
ncbi:MAG: hypothetical protein ACI4IX_06245 [Acutalibacteraceae bacterium]